MSFYVTCSKRKFINYWEKGKLLWFCGCEHLHEYGLCNYFVSFDVKAASKKVEIWLGCLSSLLSEFSCRKILEFVAFLKANRAINLNFRRKMDGGNNFSFKFICSVVQSSPNNEINFSIQNYIQHKMQVVLQDSHKSLKRMHKPHHYFTLPVPSEQY